MSRRMMSPQVLIKSQIMDDKNQVDLNEILEKYGTVTLSGAKTITLQIYNKEATDVGQNYLYDDSGMIGFVVVNGSITITKHSNGAVFIQGMLLNDFDDGVLIPFLDIPSGSYENGITLEGWESEFDLYVIRV